VPTKLLLRWRPEEVELRSRGLSQYDVLIRGAKAGPQPACAGSPQRGGRFEKIATHTVEAAARGSPRAGHASRPAGEEFSRAGTPGRSAEGGGVENPGANDALLKLTYFSSHHLLGLGTASLKPEIAGGWIVLESATSGILARIQRRWASEDADLVADLRAVWDDEDWLEFCNGIQNYDPANMSHLLGVARWTWIMIWPFMLSW